MNLVAIHTALFMFQYLHNYLLITFDNFFLCILSKLNDNTRLASKSTYYIDDVRTHFGKSYLHFSGPSMFGIIWMKN